MPKGGPSSEEALLVRTDKKLKFMQALANNPRSVSQALKAANLPSDAASRELAEAWDITVLIRREIRCALDDAGADAKYVATVLKGHVDGGSVRALELLCKLRGYSDPLPRPKQSLVPNSRASRYQRELEARDRIADLIGITSYPVPVSEGEETGQTGEEQATDTESELIASPDGNAGTQEVAGEEGNGGEGTETATT